MPCIAMVERASPKPARESWSHTLTENQQFSNSLYIFYFSISFSIQSEICIFFFIRFSKTELFFHGTFKTIIFNIHFEEKVCNTN